MKHLTVILALIGITLGTPNPLQSFTYKALHTTEKIENPPTIKSDKTTTIPPTLSNIPANTIAACENIPPPPTNIEATSYCLPNLPSPIPVSFSEDTLLGSCSGNYTLIRTWSAIDTCGNSISVSRTINVRDFFAPILSGIPSNVNVECDNIPPIPTPTATDNCGSVPSITFSEKRTDGSCNQDYILTRTWTAVDDCGNTSSQNQLIYVSDNTPPTFLNIPRDKEIACDSIPLPFTPLVLDNCDLAPTISFNEVRVDGSSSNNYTLTRTWTAVDACGNMTTESQILTVSDDTPPTLANIPPAITVECDNIPPPSQAPTATDNCDTELTIFYNQIRTNGNCANNFILTRIWTTTDDAGNTAEQSQIITVNDNTPPFLSGIPPNITVECDNIPTPNTPSAYDNCDNAPTLSYSESRSDDNCSNAYNLTRVWTATDACGNTASRSQIITVIDTTPPVLSSTPLDINLSCEDEIPLPPSITATDNCATAIVSFSENTTPNCGGNTLITRTWTATDECGNESSHTQQISIAGSLILNSPSDTVIACDGNGFSWEVPTVEESCSPSNAACPVDTAIAGFTYIGTFDNSRYYHSNSSSYTWTQANTSAIANGGHLVAINDAAENTFLANNVVIPRFWIGLTDQNTEGVFTWSNGEPVTYTNWADFQPDNYLNQDYAVFRANGYDVWYDFESSFKAGFVMEIQCSAPNIHEMTQISGPPSGSIFPEGETTISYEYIDNCGITTICSFDVIVEPCCEIEITCPDDIIMEEQANGGAFVSWPLPSVSTCNNSCPVETYIPNHSYLGEFNGAHYYSSNHSLYTWQQATAQVSAYGGHLVVIDNALENDFIKNASPFSKVWIGINDEAVEGTFELSNQAPLLFTNWSGTLNTSQRNYGLLRKKNGTWSLRSSSTFFPYIMEIPCTSLPIQISGPSNGSFISNGESHTISYLVTDDEGLTKTCSFEIAIEDEGSILAKPSKNPSFSTSISSYSNNSRPLSSVNISPNPTSTQFMLDIHLEQESPTKLFVQNMLGQIVFTKTIYPLKGNNSIPVHLPELVPGYYLLHLEHDTQYWEPKLFSIKR